jgi:hypothetical protein
MESLWNFACSWEHDVLLSAVWSLDLRTGKASRIVGEGKVPALSPKGGTVAFPQRGEHDLYVQPIGARNELVLAG